MEGHAWYTKSLELIINQHFRTGVKAIVRQNGVDGGRLNQK